VAGLAGLFERPNRKSEEDRAAESERDELLKTIGTQKVEIDFLKKKYRQIYGYEPGL
jgi:transposase